MYTPDIVFDHAWIEELHHRLSEDGPWDDWRMFQLAYEAEQSLLIPDFGELQCLKYLSSVQPFPHQIKAAKKVITEMRGRAILADEVGLGKTIEAGLIIKEYMIRGLAQKILILVPASLVTQWTYELNQKFGIPAMAQKKEYMWKQYDILVASIDTAKRPPHRNHVMEQEYDILIIDEAHKLKNRQTRNWEFVNQLKKKYCLLLTATPIQNDLHELYNLITLLKPGYLGQFRTFQNNYMNGKRKAKNSMLLKKEIEKVMVRNKRRDGNIHFTERHILTIPIQLTDEERRIYDKVTQLIKEKYVSHSQLESSLSLITLQREVCSSYDAALLTLSQFHKKAENNLSFRSAIEELVQDFQRVKDNSKAQKVIQLIKEIKDKVIIFTEYRATQEYLQDLLAQEGITSVLFRGGFRRGKKDWMRELFEKKSQVLIATEAGGEGINLQFCNQIINYDLPWNPMKVEQRIGRIHRLGQTRDVYIYNLSTSDTIEEYILTLLYEKIHLFEMVIGQLDAILEQIHLHKNIEKNIADILIESDNKREMEIKFTNLSEVIRSVQKENSIELDSYGGVFSL
ncbi:DEAD/DEAH box helicase [Microaerobacter geothermalis]|uniref:DEAD/DEAH box helicase n=1 Tax=Microaerobacter geothermalis TaxID=674972 RepID=UPI001F37FCE5|nr:SNF2-related protein [Microaerobacter geothermalis]MCF6094200.1 DEAD/DEAH box helicase [Microaerobacter geothermalis]